MYLDGAQTSCFSLDKHNSKMGAFQAAAGVAKNEIVADPLAIDAYCFDLNDLSDHLQVCCGLVVVVETST